MFVRTTAKYFELLKISAAYIEVVGIASMKKKYGGQYILRKMFSLKQTCAGLTEVILLT